MPVQPQNTMTAPSSNESQLERFFLPGPTAVHPEVLAAMDSPIVSHRGEEIREIVRAVDEGFRPALGTARPLAISTSSGTGLMEAAVLNGVRRSQLALVNGAFSERFAQIGEACGRQVTRLEVPWGQVHGLQEVVEAVQQSRPDAVSFVHSETSTGALQDIRALVAAIREASDDVAILVDSVSGAGGAELQVDEWGVDFLATAGHKALALPPGIAFGVASEAMMARSATATGKGFYFDLERFMASAKKFETPTTPAVSTLKAAQVQARRMTEEGMPARLARHAEMARATWEWVEARDLEVIAPEGARSPTVTCLTLPDGTTGPEVKAAMAERGWTITTGYGKLKESTVRIGHMGEHTVEQVEAVLAELGDVLGR